MGLRSIGAALQSTNSLSAAGPSIQFLPWDICLAIVHARYIVLATVDQKKFIELRASIDWGPNFGRIAAVGDPPFGFCRE